MTTYRVYLETYASTAITVEADDPDEALDKAYERAPSRLCHQCTGYGGLPGIELAGDWEHHSTWDEDSGVEVYNKEES